jgi:hypothetical protein
MISDRESLALFARRTLYPGLSAPITPNVRNTCSFRRRQQRRLPPGHQEPTPQALVGVWRL